MGRARGQAEVTGFTALFGNNRGSNRIDLADPKPNAESVAYAQTLSQKTAGGDITEALGEIRRAKTEMVKVTGIPKLLSDLIESIVIGVGVATRLEPHQRIKIMEALGLWPTSSISAPAPAPAVSQSTIKATLRNMLLVDDVQEEVLLALARQQQVRAFAHTLAAEVVRGRGVQLQTMLGAHMGAEHVGAWLQTLPGVPDGTNAVRVRWANERFAPRQWQGFFEAAINADDTAAYVSARLPSMIYEFAHEHAENMSR